MGSPLKLGSGTGALLEWFAQRAQYCPEGSLKVGEMGWQGPEGALQGEVPSPTSGGANPCTGTGQGPTGKQLCRSGPGGSWWTQMEPLFPAIEQRQQTAPGAGSGRVSAAGQGRAGDPSLSPAQTHLLPTEAVDAPPPEMFNVRLDGALSVWSSGKCPCPRQSSWNYIFKIPTSSEHSMILWYLECCILLWDCQDERDTDITEEGRPVTDHKDGWSVTAFVMGEVETPRHNQLGKSSDINSWHKD